ncbi:MAG TPA: hypothetical protein VG816_09760 [Solirubrobacterales bacterium]|nr:hypothetical protein [Solirubrobacterales bacterium]
MLLELAEDETFWVTLAGASTALTIALVVEARDARDGLDRLVLKASRARREAVQRSEEEIRTWTEKFDLWQNDRGDHPGDLPKMHSLPPDDPSAARSADAEAGRVLVLVLALWALGGSLLGSLVAVLPVGYPETVGDLGIGLTLILFLLGTAGLLAATTSRISRGSS